MRRCSPFIAVLCALGALGITFAGPAMAAGLSAPVADCNSHNHLTGHYSIVQLRNALATMPADVKEYTNCPDVIQRALLSEIGSSGGGGGSGTGGGSFLPTPLIVVLALLVVGGAAFGAVAWRRRR